MRTVRRHACTLLVFCWAASGSAALPAAASGVRLTVSNGMLAAVIDVRTGVVEEVLPRIYRAYDSDHRVEPFLRGFRLSGSSDPAEVEYFRNTHVVRVEYPSLSLFLFAPLTSGERVFYVAVEGEEGVVERASFAWDAIGAGVRTLELTYPLKDGNVRRYLLFSPSDSLRGEDGDLRPSRARLQTYRGSLLDDEIRYMRMVIDGARLPRALSREERDVAEQSIVVLKMAQVSPYDREIRLRGQIVASLPPGGRNIASLVDGCTAILALSRIGLKEEARDALRYFLRESRADASWSGRGLLLFAYSDYIHRNRDTLFLRESYGRVMEGVADSVAGMIQRNGLMPRDRGAEDEASPQRQSAFASAVCAAGLREFARLGRDHGGNEWRGHAIAAERLRRGISKHLVAGGKYVKGFAGPHNGRNPFHPSSFEVFALRVIADTALFRSHLRVLEKHREDFGRRVSDGLRIASALAAFGDRERGMQRVRVITARAAEHHGLIWESPDRPEGAAGDAGPMVGAGAGAYLRAIWDLNDR